MGIYQSKGDYMKIILKALAIILLVAVLFMAISGIFSLFPDWTTRGQFGDSFGFINALIFPVLICTIFLQQKEMTLQREELALQREESKLQRLAMEASRKELAEQAKTLHKQNMISIAQLRAQVSLITTEGLKLEAKDAMKDSGKFANQIIEEAKLLEKTIYNLEKVLKVKLL